MCGFHSHGGAIQKCEVEMPRAELERVCGGAFKGKERLQELELFSLYLSYELLFLFGG
jgi:hypothetical protein